MASLSLLGDDQEVGGSVVGVQQATAVTLPGVLQKGCYSNNSFSNYICVLQMNCSVLVLTWERAASL